MTLAIILLRRYWLHMLIVGIAVLSLGMAYRWAYTNGYNAANVRAEKIIADFAKAEAAAQAKVRETERRKAQAISEIAEQYERDRADAQAAADRTVADLRAGTLRLRQHWQGCPKPRMPGLDPAPSEPDAEDRLREAGAGAIVSAVAQCQAQRDGLQRVILEYLGDGQD